MSEDSNEARAARAPAVVACDVCAKEIPRSAAQTFEGSDYVRHFCGQTCLTRWREERASDDASLRH